MRNEKQYSEEELSDDNEKLQISSDDGLKRQGGEDSSRVSSDTEATDNSQEHSPINSSDDEDAYDVEFEQELRKFEERLRNIKGFKQRLTPNVSDQWIRNI